MRVRWLVPISLAVTLGCDNPPRVLCPAVELPAAAAVSQSMLPANASVCWVEHSTESSATKTELMLNLEGASPRESYERFRPAFEAANPQWRVHDSRELEPGFYVEFRRETTGCKAKDACDSALYVFSGGGDGRIPVRAAVALTTSIDD